MPKGTEMTAEAFWSRVAVGEPDECWNWMGPLYEGAGLVSWKAIRPGRPTSAYVVAWCLKTGKTPPSGKPRIEIHHLCKNRACCNPGHLIAVTDACHKQLHWSVVCSRGHMPPRWKHYGKYRTCMDCALENQQAHRDRARTVTLTL